MGATEESLRDSIFFASRALKETVYMTIELKKVYRQSDTFFLSLLNKIRENKADDEVLNELNRRYQPGFRPRKEEGYIRLTTHNYQAQQVNDRELASLSGRAYSFRAEIEEIFLSTRTLRMKCLQSKKEHRSCSLRMTFHQKNVTITA